MIRSRTAVPGRTLTVLLLAAVAAAIAGCDGDSTGPDLTPAAVVVVSGDAQEGTVGAALAEDLVVRVTNAAGDALAGVGVTWSVVSGGGQLVPTAGTTDAAGETRAGWTLGDAVGQQQASAAVGTLASATFTATAEPDVDPSLCGTLSEDLTLADIGEPYVVCTGGLSVLALLSIDPGVQIHAEEGANIRVRTGGALRAVGTEAEPILITGTTLEAGHWGGIWLESDREENELTWVEVAYGGSGSRSNLEVSHGGSVKVTHSIFRDGADYGIVATAAAAAFPEFAANELRNNAIAAMRIHANQMQYMDSASTASGNGEDVIRVTGGTLTDPQTWRRTSFPYLLTGGIGVATDVVVEAGVHMLASEVYSLNIRVQTGGSLHAVGTEDAPIRFIGATETPGSWGGLWFETDHEANELTWVEVAYGGSGDRSNLEVAHSTQVKVTNSVFRDGADYGIRSTSGGATFPVFTNNQFSGNAIAPLLIHANQIRFMDDASTATDNGDDLIHITGGTITEAQAWPRTAIPFVLLNGIDVEADVVVEPGFHMLARERYGLRIRVRSNGSFHAVGASDAPIRFVGEDPTPGTWGGIWMESASEENELTWVEVAHGGSGDRSNLELTLGSRVKITHSIFRDGTDYGIRVGSSGVTLPDFAANEFRGNAIVALEIYAHQIRFMDAASSASGNGKDVIAVRGGTLTVAQTWPRTSFPYLMTLGIGISTDVVVEPGFRMLAAEVHGMNIRVRTDGSFRAVGTPTAPIRFMGEAGTAGEWGGIWIESLADNAIEYAEIAHGGSGDFSNIYLGSGASVSVRNSTLRDSARYGIYVASSTSALNQSDNTFSGNQLGDIRWP